jgi:hypothetical protein
MSRVILLFDRTKNFTVSRLVFAALSLGAGAAITTTTISAEASMVETEVVIKTTDGDCDAALPPLRADTAGPCRFQRARF